MTEAQDVVFISDAKPVLLRLNVLIDGKPFRATHQAAWDDYLKALFRQVDRNNDGTLSAEEAGQLPPPHLNVPTVPLAGQAAPVNIAFNFRALDSDGDNKVTLAEMADYFRRFGGQDVQLAFASGSGANAASFGDALFNRLDANKDGKLSNDELTAATKTLYELDQDGDELLSPQELGARVVAAPEATGRRPPGVTPLEHNAFFFFTPTDSPKRLAQRLLDRYAVGEPGSDRKVSRAALGIPQDVFASLDANKDGALDAAELANFGNRRPDLDVTIRLGTRKPGEPPIQVAPASSADSITVKSTDDTLVLHVGKSLLELRVNPNRPTPPATARATLLQQFKDADTDNAGHLDRKKAQQRNFFPRQFGLLDHSGDGKLSESEVQNYLDQVQTAQAKAITNTTSLLVSTEGRGLFDLIDRDRDGRISRREVRTLAGLPALLGKPKADVAKEDLPQSYQFAIGLVRANFHPAGGENEAFTPSGLPMLSLEWAADGLGWFRKMDRNGDGDISPREFLGARDDFQKLDTDADGLISVEEARRVKGSK